MSKNYFYCELPLTATISFCYSLFDLHCYHLVTDSRRAILPPAAMIISRLISFIVRGFEFLISLVCLHVHRPQQSLTSPDPPRPSRPLPLPLRCRRRRPPRAHDL